MNRENVRAPARPAFVFVTFEEERRLSAIEDALAAGEYLTRAEHELIDEIVRRFRLH